MIRLKYDSNGEEFLGVTVTYEGEGEPYPTVTVRCEHPPLAIQLLQHAIVAMEARLQLEEL